jgi:hypothetical protein
VIAGSRPLRAWSSSAATTPNPAAHSRQRFTVPGKPHPLRRTAGRRLVQISENNPRPLHPVGRLGARARDLHQPLPLVRSNRQSNNASSRNHDLDLTTTSLGRLSCRP